METTTLPTVPPPGLAEKQWYKVATVLIGSVVTIITALGVLPMGAAEPVTQAIVGAVIAGSGIVGASLIVLKYLGIVSEDSQLNAKIAAIADNKNAEIQLAQIGLQRENIRVEGIRLEAMKFHAMHQSAAPLLTPPEPGKNLATVSGPFAGATPTDREGFSTLPKDAGREVVQGKVCCGGHC